MLVKEYAFLKFKSHYTVRCFTPSVFFCVLGISSNVASKAHEIGKVVFTTVKIEFQKKPEISATSMHWKLQTVSSCVDLMVWTTLEQDDQGNNKDIIIMY